MNLLGDCLQCKMIKKAITKMGRSELDSERAQEEMKELLAYADQHVQEMHRAPRGRWANGGANGDLKDELERLRTEYEGFSLRHLLEEQEL